MAIAVPLKYIVLTNWFLACWALWNPFLGLSYLFSNLTLFGLGVWAVIDKHGVESFGAFMASYVYTVLTDFMAIGRFAKKDQITDSGDPDAKFALAMAAIGLIVKFAFIYFLWVEYNTRGSAAVDGSHHQPLATGAYDPIAPQQQQGAGVGGFQAQGSFVGAPQQQLPPVMGVAPQPIGAGVQPVAGGSVGASAGGFQSERSAAMYNPGAPPPAYSSEWQCYRCTLLNAQSATVCAACQTRKPEDDQIPPPPPDEPPAFQAPMSQVQVQAGVPQGCMQVICPNCRILIALPPGMPRFLCPRCRTECMAPPMHHFVPQYQPLQPQQHMAPPPPQSMGGGAGAGNPNNMRRSPQHQSTPQQAPLPGSVSPSNRAGAGAGASHASGYHPVGGVQEVKDSGNAVGGSHLSPDSAQGRALNQSGGNANTVQGMNETRLSGLNWPRGTCALSVRAFILAQCPLLNFYWLYFMCCTNRPVRDKTRYQYEWYDTNAAKSGFTAGFVVFLGWLILYIAVGAKNHMHGYAILGSLLAVFFGPLILVVICWELSCWNQQCNSPPNCSMFDCGDCGGCCAGDCCECRALNRCCGRCDCGGCDCGGCDC